MKHSKYVRWKGLLLLLLCDVCWSQQWPIHNGWHWDWDHCDFRLKTLTHDCELFFFSAFPSSKIFPKIRSSRYPMCWKNVTIRKAITLSDKVRAATLSSSYRKDKFASQYDLRIPSRKSSSARWAKETSLVKKLCKGKRLASMIHHMSLQFLRLQWWLTYSQYHLWLARRCHVSGDRSRDVQSIDFEFGWS